MSSLIPWIGCKSKLVKYILPLFPKHTCYVEPFCGSAALFFRKEPSKVEVINDINGELINLYRVIKYHLDEFIHQFRWGLASRQLFEWENNKLPESFTDIQRAARFYYLQHMSFGGKSNDRVFGTSATTPRGLNLARIEETLSAAHLRLAHASIEHLNWQKCVERYDREETLFYLDPPYWKTADYGVVFDVHEYVHIASIMKSIKGKVILSVNDIPDMHRCFKGLIINPVTLNYTLGSNSQKASELIVTNFYAN